MILTFFDQQDHANPLNGTVVKQGEQLLYVLDSLQDRPPFFCELVGENGFDLIVGLSRTVGCAQYSPNHGNGPYMVAVAPNPGAADMEFLMGGTATPVAPRFLLPVELLKQVILHFQRTGEQSTAVSWEEI